MTKRKGSLIWLGLLLLAQSPRAWATLGGAETTIDADANALSAARHTKMRMALPGYILHEIANDHVAVREYFANGEIFAIAWNGARHPDLAGLLGTYLPEYSDANRANAGEKRDGRRGHRELRGKQLVVEKSGHLRAMRGRAYLSDRLPVGMSADDIR